MRDQDGSWVYDFQDEADSGEVRKIEHYAVNSLTGARVNLDYSPYSTMPPETFWQLVEMGFPKRPGVAPWSQLAVLLAYQTRGPLDVGVEDAPARGGGLGVITACALAILIVVAAPLVGN